MLVDALKEPLTRGLELSKVLVVSVVQNLFAEVLPQPLNQIQVGTVSRQENQLDFGPHKIRLHQTRAIIASIVTIDIDRLGSRVWGLRRGDIESLSVSDVDFESSYVTTRSKKTRKSMGSRPVPVPIMAELKKYVSGLNPEQEKIFRDRFNQYRWNKIREKVGLGDFKFHDLRKTFGSILAQNGVSTAVTQRLLEHSSSDLTNKVYTNVDPVLRQAVDLIPAGDWL